MVLAARLRVALLALPALLVGWVPTGVRAQDERLYVNPGFYAASSRVLSLGGAYVGVAEGASFTSNHASFASPNPWRGEDLDLDLTLQLAGSAGDQDLDQDGAREQARTVQGVLGARVRYRAFGLGTFLQVTQLEFTGLRVNLATAGMSGAVALWDAQLIAAAGLQIFAPSFIEGEAVIRQLAGAGVNASLLYRPSGRPYRIGASLRPRMLATPVEGPEIIAGVYPPESIVTPRVVSLGVATKLDEGRDGFNLRRERDDDPTATIGATTLVRDMFRSRLERPPGRWMVSGQIDLTFPEEGATALAHFVHGAPSSPMGGRFLVTPRLGVENVTAPGRLRLRAGGYLEPSPAEGVPPRLHATGGFDLFLFHLLFDWGLTGGLDVAERLTQGGVSFGIWN